MHHYLIKVFTLLLIMQPLVAQEFYRTAEPHPALKKPTWMKNSIQVQITPKGQKIYSENLLQVLANTGVLISENYFPKMEFKSDEAISIDRLAKENPEQFKILQTTRDFITRGVRGLELRDFKPAIQLGLSEYMAEFERFGVVTDPKMLKSIGKTEGAVLVLEMAITQLKGSATDVKIRDDANPFLGEIGIVNPALIIGTKQTPLIASIPFYVKMNAQEELIFEVIQVDANLEKVPIEVQYQKILLPSFELRVVGQEKSYTISLEDKEFDKIVQEQLPRGLQLVRDYAKRYLTKDLPIALNKGIREALQGTLGEIQNLSAAGTPENDTRPDLSLGMKLSTFNQKNNNIHLSLSAFIEDTAVRANSTPIWKKSEARGPPQFNHMKENEYDFAIAVDRVLFNRMIHLSFNRKNFNSLETCPGTPTIKLLNAPAIDVAQVAQTQDPLATRISLFIDAQITSPVDQTKGLLAPLKPQLRLSFLFHALIRPISPQSTTLGIFPEGVDTKSLVVHDDSLTSVGKLFKSKVRKEIIEVLSQESSCGNSSSIGNFELIQSIWGFPVEFKKIQMENQGHLMMYMNYKNSENL